MSYDLTQKGKCLSTPNSAHYEESQTAYQRASLAALFNSTPSSGRPLLTLVSMKDEELRRTCYNYIEEECCFGSRFVEEMILTEIWNDCAFLYTLESFTEKRESCLSTKPYNGPIEFGPEDDSEPVSNLWSVPVIVPNAFSNSSKVTEIPHSGYIKQCNKCFGRLFWTCFNCDDRGKENCSRCQGYGFDSDYSCYSCDRTGKVVCSMCGGTKKIKCETCNGYGKLRFYTKLTVKWKSHKRDHILNASRLPTDLLRQVSGKEIFKERDETVQPLNFPNNTALNEVSARLITTFSLPTDSRIVTQRHSVIAIPYTRATYIWRRKKGEFYVYGFQKQIYFKEYPQQCCCCICC
ncbi:uncharacterized protein NPIL_137531 [Nephila pilipes]|uniref:Protein SSUH2 homolog n=1 Tax=Nephila pilipes TaxID=299642 RepID=A0A8X6U274_NEPPI|nr:uncharacterized protein NPIL_137531 [Nephila pilipes]